MIVGRTELKGVSRTLMIGLPHIKESSIGLYFQRELQSYAT